MCLETPVLTIQVAVVVIRHLLPKLLPHHYKQRKGTQAYQERRAQLFADQFVWVERKLDASTYRRSCYRAADADPRLEGARYDALRNVNNNITNTFLFL